MSQFEQGNTVGEETRFQRGQSGNPNGRPKGLAALFHNVMNEAMADEGITKAEALVRRLFDLAMEGSVPALKLIMDREWPAVKQLDLSGSVDLENQHKEAREQLEVMLDRTRKAHADADAAAVTAMSTMTDAEKLAFLEKRFEEERHQSLMSRRGPIGQLLDG